MRRSLASYRDVVGLLPAEAALEKSGGHWAEFELGKATFGIGNGESLGIVPGSSFSVTFEVDDFAAACERLQAQNVAVTEIGGWPTCALFFVTDPDGNRFRLRQRKAAAASLLAWISTAQI